MLAGSRERTEWLCPPPRSARNRNIPHYCTPHSLLMVAMKPTPTDACITCHNVQGYCFIYYHSAKNMLCHEAVTWKCRRCVMFLPQFYPRDMERSQQAACLSSTVSDELRCCACEAERRLPRGEARLARHAAALRCGRAATARPLATAPSYFIPASLPRW